MSGSVKDDKPGERDPKVRELRRAPPASGSVSVPTPPRPASQKLFELDAPSTSGTHAFEFSPVTSAGVKLEGPANDVREPVVPQAIDAEQMNSELARESAEVDAEFAALANTAELEAPLLAAQLAARQATEPERFETRQLTHVPADVNFDATLKLPRSRDTLDGRRGRLAVRYKSACTAFKVLSSFEISSSSRKELVDLFSNYEASLRAVLPPTESGEKRDSDHLHNSLPAPGFDEHERSLTKVEDRLLALDDSITEDEFRAKVSKEHHPVKSLLRYARVLAMRRFNIGYRRDRFEFLAFELLTNEGSDGRLQLLARDQAGPVLHHLLAGLAQVAAQEERGPAVDHLREALDRLGEIDGPKSFFDSEFFLDLHGYKISMRDQITCPEFLYLCAAVHVELHNRLLAWSRSGTPSAASLDAQLQTQQRAAEEVFSSFRRPRSTPAAKSSPRPAPSKEALPQPAASRRKKRKRAAKSVEKPSVGVWLKLAGLSLVIVLSTTWLLYTTGVFQVGTPPAALSSPQLLHLSPLLLRATLSPRQHQLDGLVSRPAWQRLSKHERRAAAADLAAKLKQKNIPNARIVAYKAPVITIEFSTVVFVDEG
ncbi:MAG TPA: hypothetical protein VFG30_13775 [Polyangiales bacterium]|nr:hypothetical protein [Polyangiales bacterium]